MRGGPGADRETELRGGPAEGGVSGYPEVWGGILPERVHGESRQVNFDLFALGAVYKFKKSAQKPHIIGEDEYIYKLMNKN